MSRVTQARAVRAFVDHVMRGGGSTGRELDELCRAHPDLAPDLQRMARERAEAKVEPPRVALASGASVRRGGGDESRYVLLGELARGGMGVVLDVWDTVLERQLAMKILGRDAAAGPEHEDARARFLAEARIAGRLQHPGIVPVHDLGEDEQGRVYFTMSLCEGSTLDEVFELAHGRSDGWSLGRALLVVVRASEAMAYAHAHGVIHRDLKPANVIAGPFGEIHVVDWGLAKVVDPVAAADDADGGTGAGSGTGADGTLAGTVAGTPPYMAPEQALGKVDEVSYPADIYAFGAMLYRLLAGRPPYAPRQGTEDAERTVELIRRGPPTPLRRLAPDAPEPLVAVAEKAMARAPEERHASVHDLARELHEFLEERLGTTVLP